MRVLVSGATGLIGSAVCDALLARGDEVVGLTRDPEKARPKNATVRWHAWDATSERPPPESLEEVDAVVNLIGESLDQRWTKAAKERIVRSRVDATRNLLQGLAAAEASTRTFISQSAVGYYGDRGAALLDEESGPGEGFSAELCVAWEREASKAAEAGMRLVILRSGPVLSRHGGLLRRLLTPFRLGVGGPIAGGDQYISWIQLEDEVGLILWALDNERVSDVLNATAPEPVSNRELAKGLGKALGRPAVIPVPGFAVSLLRGPEMAAEAVKRSQRVLPRRVTDLGYSFRHPDLEGALEAALR